MTSRLQWQFWQFPNDLSYLENHVVRVTLAYGVTFLSSRGCPCKRECLYTWSAKSFNYRLSKTKRRAQLSECDEEMLKLASTNFVILVHTKLSCTLVHDKQAVCSIYDSLDFRKSDIIFINCIYVYSAYLHAFAFELETYGACNFKWLRAQYMPYANKLLLSYLHKYLWWKRHTILNTNIKGRGRKGITIVARRRLLWCIEWIDMSLEIQIGYHNLCIAVQTWHMKGTCTYQRTVIHI